MSKKRSQGFGERKRMEVVVFNAGIDLEIPQNLDVLLEVTKMVGKYGL